MSHVVAIAELATPIEAEASALAADLATTAYEARLKLAGGLPAIVQLLADPRQAEALAERIRARGHAVLVFSGDDVVPASSMISMRRFALEPDAVSLPDVPGARVPFADILGLFRANHDSRTESRQETKSTKFSMGRALLSGGLVMTKSVTREDVQIANEREQVLYVFRASGETPWLLRERATNYAGLGAALGPSSMQNFMTTIQRLRAAAPHAAWSERLMAPIRAPGVAQVTSTKTSSSVSSASAVDLYAHMLAASVRAAGGR